MELTGPEKAVLLLLSLDESAATPIIGELDADDLRKLREVAAMMRAVPASSLSSVYVEFLEKTREAVALPRGGVRYLRRIASRALGEARTDEIFVDAPQTAMERLAHAESGQLASVLENEHPQLVAAILSQLEPAKAARVLEQLPDAKRPLVLERLGNMTEVPAGLLEEAAAALGTELPAAEAEAFVSVDGLSRSAALVRRMNKQNGEALLGVLAEGNADLARDIRRSMYSFEDLCFVDAKGMRALLEAVPVEKLTVALKTASEPLKAHVFGSMSKRAADRIREDMDILGSVRVADVEAAQREILEIAMQLASEGVITLDAPDG
jgi:flagellar motor switch protein FliG